MARTVDKGHGRLEVRTLRLTSTLTKAQDWAGLKQGFEITRERTEKGVKSVEVVHGITSLGRERAAAARLLGLVREHWGIEKHHPHCPSSNFLSEAQPADYHRPGGTSTAGTMVPAASLLWRPIMPDHELPAVPPRTPWCTQQVS